MCKEAKRVCVKMGNAEEYLGPCWKMQKQFGGRAFGQKWISGHGAQVSEIVCSPDENATSMHQKSNWTEDDLQIFCLI